MIRSDIWRKWHEWYFEIVVRIWDNFGISRVVFYAKYHVQIMLPFVYTTSPNFHMKVFQIKLKYHCSKPIKLQKFLM